MNSTVLPFQRALSAEFPRAPNYRGPERRNSPGGLLGQVLAVVLDEIDLGLILIDDDGHVRHANRMAQRRLDGCPTLTLDGESLCTRLPSDQAKLQQAVRAAIQQGLRRLLTLGTADARVSVSVIPVSLGLCWSGALLLLGKQQLCENLSLHAFAREFGLTAAEQEVLQGLCAGLQPQDIATRHSVALSTIRTQIASVRGKTQVDSIRELIGMVALLPPMLTVQPMREATEAVRLDMLG